MTQDSTSTAHVVDLEALAGFLCDRLEDPVNVVDGDEEGDAFVRFDARVNSHVELGEDARTIRAVVTLVSDGEDEVEGAAGEVLEVIVRRVPA